MAADADVRPVRIGIVGAGANTRARHIPGFQSIPGVKIVLVCNRSEESSRKVAREFGIPLVAAHWRDVAAAADVDAVIIGSSIGGKSIGRKRGVGDLKLQAEVQNGFKGVLQTSKGIQELILVVPAQREVVARAIREAFPD